jgi:hypothetical protein
MYTLLFILNECLSFKVLNIQCDQRIKTFFTMGADNAEVSGTE